jgi:hypothetical protein
MRRENTDFPARTPADASVYHKVDAFQQYAYFIKRGPPVQWPSATENQ